MNSDFIKLMGVQFALHPSMQPQDVIKLCYQAAFGAEHLLSDIAAAREYFLAEFDSAGQPAHDVPLAEYISPDTVRVNLGGWRTRGLPADWLFEMFALSASAQSNDMRSNDAPSAFAEYIAAAEKIIESGGAPFTSGDWRRTFDEYMAGGLRAVHHSDIYRRSECPSYRIVSHRIFRLLPVLERLLSFEKSNDAGRAAVIAIDGRAASGKSTAAEYLSATLGCPVVHMDDFFLPLELRTGRRFDEPGGNVHYERFAEEVLPYLAGGGAFSYRFFDCGIFDYNGVREVPASRRRIVEGSYSHHPRFGGYADIRVFLDVAPEEQMRRILIRNGAEKAEIFRDRWIPFEEKYFERCGIRTAADIVIE